MKRLILCFCLLSGVLHSQLVSQSPLTSYAVLFRSGTEVLPENVQDFAISPKIAPSEVVNGRFYRLIQFYSLPSLIQRQQLEQKGWIFETYLPHNAYLVSLPVSNNWGWLSAFNIRSIVPLEIRHKMHPDLVTHDIPPYAVREDQVVLQGLVAQQVPIPLVQQQLRLEGAEIDALYPAARLIQFSLSISKVDQIAAIHGLQYLDFISEPGQPEDNRQSSLHRSNVLHANYPGAPSYDGSGVKVVVRDDGNVGPHIDFQGRLSQTFALDLSVFETHGDRVASVVGSAGNLDPSILGMAPGATIYVMDYDVSGPGPTFQDSTIHLHRNEGVMITNSSYSNGCNGGYTLTTRTVDDQAYANPNLLHVFSAGNSGTLNCGYGAGSDWGNITGGHKVAKNVIATASLTVTGNVVNSSSRGPAEDGRLKPDISAMGSNVIMTTPINEYVTSSGTSFSSPAIAGISAQLYQAYKELNGGNNPEAALIKAAIMNSAEDLGNPGPDFIHGFGLVHAGRALDILKDNQYQTGSSQQDSVHTHTFTIPAGVKEARFMVYWQERASSVMSAKVLINDLDMRVQTPSAGQVLPLVLDPTPNVANLDSDAVPGIDTLNNVEQVVLLDPVAGTYTVEVDGKSVPDGMQEYYVLYSFLYDEIAVTYPIGGESLVPGQQERIRWDAYGTSAGLGSFTLEFSSNGGNSWSPITNLPSSNRQYNWTVPATVTEQARIRVSRNGLSDMGEANFNIIGQPNNLNIDQVCPGSLSLSWQAVPGATAYDVFVLGDTYMDSVDRVQAPQLSATISIPDLTQEYWVSVRAIGANGLIGRRAVAILHPGGRVNCLIADDVEVDSIFSVFSGPFQDCFTNETLIQAEVTNLAPTLLSDIPIFYQYDQQAIVADTIPGPIPSAATFTHTFSNLQDLGAAGTHQLKVWTNFPTDSLPYNDTLSIPIVVNGGFTQQLAFIEDFEGFDLCSTSSNCAEEICELSDGWVNYSNGIQDDIDWRTNQGFTPSNGTGPNIDHRPGSDIGTYLYLEASGGCTDQMASLESPCIDLSGVSLPELSFWAHMEGDDVGELHIDVMSSTGNGSWDLDIRSPYVGSQGNDWFNSSIDLSAYAGSSITIRFRGITGGGFQSDIALDDISVFDKSGPPAIDFSADFTDVCIGSIISFTETSLNQPSGFVWKFFPDLVTFENGSSETSPNPSVSFIQPGTYSVLLIASNSFGSDSLIRTDYIEVSEGIGLDVVENFEADVFPTQHWSAENPDDQLQWERVTVGGIGSIGGLSSMITHAALLENASSGVFLQAEDYLVSRPINLAGADKPWLLFDVSFALAGTATTDELRVDISTDCGATYSPVYSKSDTLLATIPSFEAEWFPTEDTHWRRDSIDLGAFIDESILIRFVGVNKVGQSNNLYLDNIQVRELGTGAPLSNFAINASTACEGETILLTDMSTGDSISTYLWDFGSDAIPATASTAGPHTVSYGSSGIKTIFLSVSNGGDTTTSSRILQIDPLPLASYAVDILGLTFTFNNQSQNAGSYLWDFGDGNSSTEANPVHTYMDFDQYDVSLIATSDCGSDTFSLKLVGNEAGIEGASIQIVPNPNTGSFSVELRDPQFRSWEASLIDLHGRKIQDLSFETSAAVQIAKYNSQQLAEGVYMIQLTSGSTQLYRKLMIIK
ncbi:MAG: S8 family serine peptidase [Bacteroidota bacterium]